MAVQNVNKGFVYITDLTWSLNFMISIDIKYGVERDQAYKLYK
jgi:hypothetical protein